MEQVIQAGTRALLRADAPALREARRWPFRLLLVTVTCVLSLLLSEGAVRLLAPQTPSWLAVYRTHPRLDLFSLDVGVHEVVNTGETSWTIHTDEAGFRVGSRERAGAGEPLALWLGDSFTFAHGVDFEQSFVGLLEARADRRFHFVNAAVPGYGMVQYRQVLEDLLSNGVEPARVLVGTFLGNDIQDCVCDKAIPVRGGVLGDREGVPSFFKRSSHLYRLIGSAYHRARRGRAPLRPEEVEMAKAENWRSGPLHDAFAVYRQELERIAQLCRQRSIPLAVVILPSARMLTSPRDEADADYALPIRQVTAALFELGIQTIDPCAALARRPTEALYFAFDGHFTPDAHRAVCAALLAQLPALVTGP